MKTYDAVVIGGGPAGMTAALYLLRSGASVAVVEKLSPGGQILMTSELENYPGFPKGIKGYELADLMAAHVDLYPHDTLNDEVREIAVGPRRHRIRVGSDWIEAKAVILCSGARYRRLGVPGEEAFIGRGVSYCALCDGNFFRDRVVAVVGGGNSALEEALYLSRLVKKLYLIHRRDEFRGCKCYQDKCLTHPKMQVLTSSVVQEISGDSEVRAVLVRNLKSAEVQEIPVDGVFVFVGFEPVIDFVPVEVARDKGGLITDLEMRTNVPGIFAAGDIRSKNCRQVATAVGDGATAATAAFAYLEQLDD